MSELRSKQTHQEEQDADVEHEARRRKTEGNTKTGGEKRTSIVSMGKGWISLIVFLLSLYFFIMYHIALPPLLDETSLRDPRSSLKLDTFSKELDDEWLPVLANGTIADGFNFIRGDAFAEKYVFVFEDGKRALVKMNERLPILPWTYFNLPRDPQSKRTPYDPFVLLFSSSLHLLIS